MKKKAAWILGFVCLILAIGMFSGWRKDDALRAKLKESGKRAEASVTAASERFSAAGRTGRREDRMLTVTYTVDRQTVSKDFRVTEKGFADHPRGSKLDVLYDPDDPERSVIAGDFELHSASSAWIGGIMFGVLAIGLLGYAVLAKRP